MIVRASNDRRYHSPRKGGFKKRLYAEPSLRIVVPPTVRVRKRLRSEEYQYRQDGGDQVLQLLETIGKTP